MVGACVAHLRAWLLDEADSILQTLSDSESGWAADFLSLLWADCTLSILLTEAAFLFPRQSFERFLIFAARNYPAELAGAVTYILHDHPHAAADMAWALYLSPIH